MESPSWHLKDSEEVLKITESHPDGISAAKAGELLNKYGLNELQEKKKKPLWLIFLLQFKDVMIIILLGAAVISGVVGDLTDTIVILIIVLLNAVIGFVQEFRAEKAMEALKKMSVPTATVLREGKPVQVEAATLVPGDIVTLEAGNIVPADMRLLKSHSLQVEEASLTGESSAVEKQTDKLKGEDLPIGDRTNMAYKGTVTTYGRGKGIVVETGMNTEIGRIAELLQEEEAMTPLQKRLGDFGKKLSFVVLGICIVLYIVGILRGEDPIKMLLTAISLAVAAIPEALPAVVTIALAMGARRLARKNVLIRKLPAVETLGSVTFICTDKTGTLTQNKMSVTETWVPETPPKGLSVSAEEALFLCMALNHDVKKDDKGELTGESTELALAAYAEEKHGALKKGQYKRVGELPFDSDRKLMTTVHKWDDDKFLIVTKGALEAILKACDDPDEKAMSAEAERMGKDGLRLMAYGCRLVNKLPAELTFKNMETKLECCGLVGMTDPPRKEAAKAIKDCQDAGMVPVMITGDHPVTAASIAKQLGILRDDTDKVLTGAELSNLSDAKFKSQIEHVKVYARVSPEQKLQIVKILQKKQQFVAMTGDGVNDAPALRRANIGVAMGITGTDVSKEAAHMILLDDNFATIIKAVKEGRRIFDNIRKFIKYAMTGNSGEIWTIFLAPLFGMPIPLLPIHILWINLVTDGLPGLALAYEKAENDVMKVPPRKTDESIFAHGMGIHILWVGLLMGIVCLVLQAWAIERNDPKWQTYVFTVLCFSQMGHVLAIRSDHTSIFRQGFLSNLPLLGAVLLTFGLQMCLIYVPVFHDIFSTQELTLTELCWCILGSLVVFFAVEGEKLIKHWRKPKEKEEKKPVKRAKDKQKVSK